jgi:outer membrane lipoprotein
MALIRSTPFFALLPVLLIAGCASVPAPLQGDFRTIAANEAATGNAIGALVRWGGVVIGVEPQKDRTCIQVLARPLGERSGRPLDVDRSDGRFLACRAGFYDPEIFATGREVTVTGEVVAMTQRTIGEFDYAMPELAAGVIYLWPPRIDYDRSFNSGPWPGWYHPWSPWYGPWGHPRFHGGFHHRPRPRPIASPDTRSTPPGG